MCVSADRPINIHQLQPQSKSPIKRVTFNESCNEYKIIKITRSDRKNRWYTAEDFQRMKRDIRRTIQELKIRNGDVNMLDNEKFCLRGLEHSCKNYIRQNVNNATPPYLFLSGMPRQQDLRYNIVQSVLELQKEQKSWGIEDAEGLKALSAANSKRARKRAIQLASQDCEDALRI